MTNNCVYCKSEMEMGCDTKTEVRDGTWCGQCKKGRDSLFGHWGTGSLKLMKDTLEKQYDLDPIEWGTNLMKGGVEAHWNRLWLHDLIGQIGWALKEREGKDE